MAKEVCTFAQHYTVLFLCQLSILALMVGRVVQEEFPLAEGRIGNPQTLIIVHLFFMGILTCDEFCFDKSTQVVRGPRLLRRHGLLFTIFTSVWVQMQVFSFNTTINHPFN